MYWGAGGFGITYLATDTKLDGRRGAWIPALRGSSARKLGEGWSTKAWRASQSSKMARRIVTDSEAFSSARTNRPPPAWATRCMNAAASG